MNWIDYITIIFFALGVFLAGLAFSGKQKNIKSFFSGGGAGPWGISGLSLFMGFFSAGTFVVWGAIAYSHGAVAISIQESMCVAGVLVGLFIASKWHKTGALTAAEYITERYGASVQKIYSCLFLLISLFNTGAFLYPIAKILSVSTGFPIDWCIIVLGLFCIIYVSLGGLWSVVITDVLQFIVLTVAVIVTVPLSLKKIGGVDALLTQAPQGFFDIAGEAYPLAFIIAFGIYNTVFIGGNWAYVQRYTSVRTDKDSKKVAFLFSALYLVCPVLWMLPPMVYRILNPGLAGMEDEGAYLMMCKEALPNGMLGMILGGMIFATASSFNATLNISAGVFTHDIFGTLKPRSSQKTLLNVARISTVAFGLLAVIVALLIPKMGGIVNVVISIAALTGVPLYLPVIWSLFSKYQTKKSILSATVLSLLINAAFKFVTPAFGFSLDRTWEMIVGVSVPVILLAAYEIYARACKGQDPAYARYKEWEKERAISDERDAAGNDFGIKVIRIGVCIVGAMVLILGAVAEHDRLLIIVSGIVLLMVGALLGLKRKK